MRMAWPDRPIGAEGGHGDRDPAVVEDDRRRPGDRARAASAARSWATGRAARAALVRRAVDVVVGQAQPALLLGGQRCRRRDGAAAMLARDRRAPPRAVGRSEVRADARARPRRARRRRWPAVRGARLGRPRSSRRRIAGPRPSAGRRGVSATAGRPAETQKSRRRPIFPKGCPLSIFGAGELNFRVRDGNGCGLSARVTGIFRVWMVSAAARRTVAMDRAGRRNGSSISSSQWDLITILPATDPWSVAEEVKPSTVSTAQLHPSPDFHMRPIKQVVSLRSYPVDPVGNLISRRASHLDAFSAYPDRT